MNQILILCVTNEQFNFAPNGDFKYPAYLTSLISVFAGPLNNVYILSYEFCALAKRLVSFTGQMPRLIGVSHC